MIIVIFFVSAYCANAQKGLLMYKLDDDDEIL